MHSHELTLGFAFGLGAIHALEPGHGKTAMLLYLAGELSSSDGDGPFECFVAFDFVDRNRCDGSPNSSFGNR